jgi:hypothetical protein
MTPTVIEPMMITQPSREFNDCSRSLFRSKQIPHQASGLPKG